MIRRASVNYLLISFEIDLLCWIVSFYTAASFRVTLPYGKSLVLDDTMLLEVLACSLIIWTITFFVLPVYDASTSYRAIDEFQTVVWASIVSLLVFSGTLFFFYRDLSRLLVVYYYSIATLALLGWRGLARIVLRWFGLRIYRQRRVVIIGASDIGLEIAKAIQERQETGLELLGIVDDNQASDYGGVRVVGSLSSLPEIIQAKHVDEAIIAFDPGDYQKITQLILQLHIFPIQIRIVPNYLNLALHHATLSEFGDIPLINLRDLALTPPQRFRKRVFDLVVGTVAAIITLPFMVIIGILIRLDSPGPVIFKQTRIGENGRPFTMYKFRSMTLDANARLTQAGLANTNRGLYYKAAEDPRVTRMGRFIRSTGLDELPQLLNVLIGNMSLVGPRPELPELVDKYNLWQRKRFAVPQGMTGWWQVNGRSNQPMYLVTEDDLYYIENYSILLDLYILWRTIGVMLRREGI